MDKTKILVVDDESRMRKLVKDFLARQGYTVLEAADGMEAMDYFYADKDIALIILDVMMPEMNGYQVCLLVREKTNAPILFLTAKGQESDKTLGFSSGGDDYLTKPFSYNELNARVKALLRRYHVYQGKERHEENTIQIIGDLEINQSKKEVRRQGKKLALTCLLYTSPSPRDCS